jgi:hypothetical protein
MVNGRPWYVPLNGLAIVLCKEAMQARMRSRTSATAVPALQPPSHHHTPPAFDGVQPTRRRRGLQAAEARADVPQARGAGRPRRHSPPFLLCAQRRLEATGRGAASHSGLGRRPGAVLHAQEPRGRRSGGTRGGARPRHVFGRPPGAPRGRHDCPRGAVAVGEQPRGPVAERGLRRTLAHAWWHGPGGAARSRACRPVCSSGLMPGPPGAALAGAGGATAHPAVPGAVHAPGASGVAWRPYAPRGGGQAA